MLKLNVCVQPAVLVLSLVFMYYADHYQLAFYIQLSTANLAPAAASAAHTQALGQVSSMATPPALAKFC